MDTVRAAEKYFWPSPRVIHRLATIAASDTAPDTRPITTGTPVRGEILPKASGPAPSMQAAAWVVCTMAAFITARNRQIAQHRQWMARSYAVTFTFVSSRVLDLWPRYWSHLGDTLAAVGVIAFTLASLLVVDLGLNWRELTTRRV